MKNEALVSQIQADHERGLPVAKLMQQLYEQNKYLIYSTVKVYAEMETIEDLLQEAYIPLYRAALTYKPDREISFITFACTCIKHHLVKYLEDSGLIHIPQGMRMKLYRYKQFVDRFTSDHGRKPERSEICRELGLKRSELALIEKYRRRDLQSLDAPLNDDTDNTVADTIASNSDLADEITEKIYREKIKKDVQFCKDHFLTEREKTIIDLYYRDGLTLSGIAEKIGGTCDTVRTQKDRAELKLRAGKSHRILSQYEPPKTLYYQGSLTFYRQYGSITEYAAIKQI